MYTSVLNGWRTQGDQHITTAATKLYPTTAAIISPVCGGYPCEELVQITDMTPSSTYQGEEWHSTETRQGGERQALVCVTTTVLVVGHTAYLRFRALCEMALGEALLPRRQTPAQRVKAHSLPLLSQPLSENKTYWMRLHSDVILETKPLRHNYRTRKYFREPKISRIAVFKGRHKYSRH